MSIRVVMADDHAMVRESLTAYLATTFDVQVVATVGRTEDAVDAVSKYKPDVVMLDIDMPGMVAFDAARRIKSICGETRVVILSAFSSDRYIEQALAVGASGYLTKAEPLEHILDAIRGVAAGSEYFSPEIRARIVIDRDKISLLESGATRVDQLSDRELETLRYVARGLSNKEIASQMRLAVRTVDHHVANLMSTLDIHERVNLARFAIREGLAEP